MAGRKGPRRASSGERLLLTQRGTAHLLERARIFAEGGRVLYAIAEGGVSQTFAMPHANIAVLLVGQGASLTSEAARLLGAEGVGVAFTGTGGTPIHFGSLINYQPTANLFPMVRVCADPDLSLAAAKTILASRIAATCAVAAPLSRELFGDDTAADLLSAAADFDKALAAATAHDIMAREAHFAKAIYGVYARATGIAFRRSPGDGGGGDGGGAAPPGRKASEADAEERRIALCNARIDHGNYLAYGIGGTCLWTLGIPASLSVLHGKTRAGGLVFDLADAFKDAFVLPLAFAGHADERSFRGALLDTLHDKKALALAFETMKTVIELGARAGPADAAQAAGAAAAASGTARGDASDHPAAPAPAAAPRDPDPVGDTPGDA